MMALLGRFWPHLAVAAVILIAIAKADANGARRAELAAENARLERQALAIGIVDEVKAGLNAELAELARQTNGKIIELNRENRHVVQPIIQREIVRDPALLSSQCLTPELLRAVNVARGSAGDGIGSAEDQRASPVGVPGSAAGKRR